MDFRRGDIWFVNLGDDRVGSEQRNWHPIIVISNESCNRNSPVIEVATITSQLAKASLPTHVVLDRTMGLAKSSIVLCEQIVSMDKKRFLEKGTRYITNIKGQKIKEINQALEVSLGLSNAREREALTQLEEVNKAEYHLEEMKSYGIIAKSILAQAQIKFEYELRKLENICIMNRLYLDNYYKGNTASNNTNSSTIYDTVSKNSARQAETRGIKRVV